MSVQPVLHTQTVLLRAPTQIWSASDGSIGAAAGSTPGAAAAGSTPGTASASAATIDGVYFGDVRVISGHRVSVNGVSSEPVAARPEGASSATFVSMVRAGAADPSTIVEVHRRASTTGMTERLTVRTRELTASTTDVVVRLVADLTDVGDIRLGDGGSSAAGEILVLSSKAGWANDAVTVLVSAPGAQLTATGPELELRWSLTVPATGDVSVEWDVAVTDDLAVVVADESELPWNVPTVTGNERLSRWLTSALADLDALRMTATSSPDYGFVAAGAPWYFTLFGRDAIWTARFMLPLGTELAADTLRVLAGLQGTNDVPDTGEAPGKILHELQRSELRLDDGVTLPPLYFGTVDATALWVCLLHDAWRWGLDDSVVAELLPGLEAALGWLRDSADADGDGLLEYIDASGHGLVNQGWKDSPDAIQWRDGHIAHGPIVLCEVQGYAYEAATHGADLLDHFGRDGTQWRIWATALKEKFHEAFWIGDVNGSYPAIALDADKQAVDALTSNIGHLLGTGLLDDAQSALVARRLVSHELNSGYGLRTLSTDAHGYWPLSYHGGSVWAHDTAIAIAGLRRAGFRDEAAVLIEGLLEAASAFEYRMPELHSGEAAVAGGRAMPYPSACRPQAWSAAAAVSVLSSVLGLEPDAQDAVLGMSPLSMSGLEVSGLRFSEADVSVTTNTDGEITAANGATIDVR